MQELTQTKQKESHRNRATVNGPDWHVLNHFAVDTDVVELDLVRFASYRLFGRGYYRLSYEKRNE